MFQGIIVKLLLKYLGGIFDGIDKKNIQVGAWEGDLRVSKLEIKPSLFENKDLPFTIISSSIGQLVIKVPWTKIATQSIEITLTDMNLNMGLLDETNWNFKDFTDLEIRLEALKNHAASFLQVLRSNMKELTQHVKKTGYFKQLILKAIDNIAIKLENIDLTIKMQSSNLFGFSFKQLDVATIDPRSINREDFFNQFSKAKHENYKYKIAKIDGFAIYWIPSENYIDQFNSEMFEEHKNESVSISHDQFSQNNEKRRTIMSFDGSAKIALADRNYANTQSEYINFNLEIERIDVTIGLDQIEDFIDFINFMKKHNQKKRLNAETIIHSCYRPSFRPSQEKKNIPEWWKYAAKSSMHYSYLSSGK